MSPRTALIAVAALLALTASASAQTRIGAGGGPASRGAAPPPPTVIDGVVWTKLATLEEVRFAYPLEARKAKLEGKAVISCLATAGGKVTNCSVVSETPEDAGFGAAAVKLGGRFRMATLDNDRRPVAGRQVTIPVHFSLVSNAMPFSADPGQGQFQISN